MTDQLVSLPSLTTEEFAELKASIEQHKGRNSEAQLGKISPKSGVTEDELQELLARADEVFANEEWEDCERRYRRIVQDLRLGPAQNLGRFALSLAHVKKYKEAVEVATRSYKADPADSAAYEAMARCALANDDLVQTCLWSRLASLASPHPSLAIEELSVSSTRELEHCTFELNWSFWTLKLRIAQNYF